MEPVSPLTSSLFHRGAEMQTLRVPMCSTLILYIILYCELETVCYQPLVEGRGRGGYTGWCTTGGWPWPLATSGPCKPLAKPDWASPASDRLGQGVHVAMWPGWPGTTRHKTGLSIETVNTRQHQHQLTQSTIMQHSLSRNVTFQLNPKYNKDILMIWNQKFRSLLLEKLLKCLTVFLTPLW